MVSKRASKMAVSRRAVLARLNRALAKENMVLRACRAASNSLTFWEFGPYYALNTHTNFVEGRGLSLEGWARKYEVLKPYEILLEE